MSNMNLLLFMVGMIAYILIGEFVVMGLYLKGLKALRGYGNFDLESGGASGAFGAFWLLLLPFLIGHLIWLLAKRLVQRHSPLPMLCI